MEVIFFCLLFDRSLDAVKALHQDERPGAQDQNSCLKRLIYDLLWKGLKGVLKRDQAASALGELSAIGADVTSSVVDVLSVVDTETALMGIKDDRDRFVGILRDAEKYLPEGTLKERMEIDTLGEAGIVKNHKKFFTTVIKMKTKLL